MVVLCVSEVSLGLGLVATLGAGGTGGRADLVRVGTAMFFLVGMCALVELRERRPDAGCGCFGDLSIRPPGARSIARAGLLAGAALAGLNIPPLSLPAPGPAAARDLGILAAEFLLLVAVSPESGEILARLGYAEPCELAALSPGQVMTALRRSAIWYRHSGKITSDSPADMWRELCWCYLVFPGREQDEDCEVVFAVELKARRPKSARRWSGPRRIPRKRRRRPLARRRRCPLALSK